MAIISYNDPLVAAVIANLDIWKGAFRMMCT